LTELKSAMRYRGAKPSQTPEGKSQ